MSCCAKHQAANRVEVARAFKDAVKTGGYARAPDIKRCPPEPPLDEALLRNVMQEVMDEAGVATTKELVELHSARVACPHCYDAVDHTFERGKNVEVLTECRACKKSFRLIAQWRPTILILKDVYTADGGTP